MQASRPTPRSRSTSAPADTRGTRLATWHGQRGARPRPPGARGARGARGRRGDGDGPGGGASATARDLDGAGGKLVEQLVERDLPPGVELVRHLAWTGDEHVDAVDLELEAQQRLSAIRADGGRVAHPPAAALARAPR